MNRRIAAGLVGATVATAAAWSACYRESTGSSSSSPLGNNGDPALLANDETCRRDDDLNDPPIDVFPEGRLRSHSQGQLTRIADGWSGPDVRDHIPRMVDTLDLFILDEADGGQLAFYRESYNRNSCQLSGNKNCAYVARFYDGAKRLVWSLKLNDVMSRATHLEVQDIRLSDGVLYFNEACQSYSADARGACSSLVAVDPRAKKVLWRTPSLVSNGRFRLRGCYVVAGYGFTAEPDALHLVDRSTGKVTQTVRVSSSPEQYNLMGKERLDVSLYSGVTRRYKLENFETHAGRIVELDGPEYGGAGYGGFAYGGGAYGGLHYGGLPRKPPNRR